MQEKKLNYFWSLIIQEQRHTDCLPKTISKKKKKKNPATNYTHSNFH